MKTDKKPRQFKTIGILLAMSILFALSAAGATAASYPSKPVRLIVPQPPGGSTDNYGRLIAAKLSERLGMQVVTENRAGAGTVIGTEFVAKSNPDGYTLLFAPASYSVAAAVQKVPYDPIKDFIPIAKLGSAMNMLVVHQSVPANSLKEFLALAKQKPGQLIFASQGAGSQVHLSIERFRAMAGIDVKLVQFKGGAPATIDLLGGHSHASIGTVMVNLPHIKAGKLKPLCVFGVKRSSLLPDMPTSAEAGVPECESGSWYGILAPAGTPKAIIDRLNNEVKAIMATDEIKTQFLADGTEVDYQGPTEFDAFIKSEISRWDGVVKKANIKQEE
jgi:tripartite-type tricarboxylate transporter receptor subunit TctC